MGEEEEVKEEEILGNNSIEDASWLFSLSESELNFFISLKKAAMRRAYVFGHVQLANMFDLKMLRSIGLSLMKHHKETVKDLSLVPGVVDSAAFLDCSGLLKKCELDDVMSIAELKERLAFKTRKEFCKRPREKNAMDGSCKKPKSEDPNEETESQQQKVMTSDLVNVEETISCHD